MKLGIRKWLSFIIAGFVGQLAWAIENNYFNLYVYEVAGDTKYITIMTAASAAAATITTLLMGALSDRLGKRKMFIYLGYILWGISIILFAFLDPGASIKIVTTPLMAGTMIVIMDCVMTFFGSTANDAAFNAFVTDNTEESNRGKVESVLSVLPLISMIAVVGVAGFLTNADNKTNWSLFFYIFGGLTLVTGLVCIFLLPKDKIEPNKSEPYIKNIFYGFRPKVIKNNAILYLTLLAFMIFSMGIQVFMPYLMVYIQNVLEIKEMNFTITLVVVLLVASIIAVVFGLFMDRIGKNKIMIPAIGVAAAGALSMFFIKTQVGVMIGGTIMMAGYMIGTAVLGAKVRDYTPENEVGLFQGVRMIFFVLLPMVTGPFIGRGVSYINAIYYQNDYGETVIQPNAFIFLFAAIVISLAIIPSLIIIKKERERLNGQSEETAN